MKTVGKMVLTLVALLSIAATASAATDKLIVNNTGGTPVFKVDDAGAITAPKFAVDQNGAITTPVFSAATNGKVTITNVGDAESVPKFAIKDATGVDCITMAPQGEFVFNGAATATTAISSVRLTTNSNHATASATTRSTINYQKSRGTKSVPAAVIENDQIGTLAFGGHDGSAYQFGALMNVYADGPVTGGSVPMRYSIVTGSNSTNRLERLVIKNDGKVGIGTNAPTSILQVVGLPVAENNTEATTTKGLTPGAFYRTSTGVLMVAY